MTPKKAQRVKLISTSAVVAINHAMLNEYDPSQTQTPLPQGVRFIQRLSYMARSSLQKPLHQFRRMPMHEINSTDT